MKNDWFYLEDVIKKRLAKQVWIPLRLWKRERQGKYGFLGFQEEVSAVRTVAINLKYREVGEQISWQDTLSGNGVYSDEKTYITSDTYQNQTGQDTGIFLCLSQSCNGLEKEQWYLHQDIEIAFGLLREGDVWVCPQEDYDTVVKIERDSDGKLSGLLMKCSYLREYLYVRQLALRITSYFSRSAVVEQTEDLGWSNPVQEYRSEGRFEGRERFVHPGGEPFGNKTGVFHMARTDVNFDEDIPEMGPETDENMTSKSWTIGSEEGDCLTFIEGEFWRNEWVEPADQSAIIRYKTLPSAASFIVDSTDKRASADQLNDEDIGRWLWFKPSLISDLLSRRNTSLHWHTAETATIKQNGYNIFFGINSLSLVTVYAHDIARLSEWQRIICQGHNVRPDGKVSAELLSSQVHAKPASTQAPESFIEAGMQRMDLLFQERRGEPLFDSHAFYDKILPKLHRFRSTDRGSLLALAKDLARISVDRLRKKSLQACFEVPHKDKLGSLKSLEYYVAELIGKKDARLLIGPLFGVYELRLADAHPPSSDISGFYILSGVNTKAPFLQQGFELLRTFVSTIWSIAKVMEQHDVKKA